MKDAGVDQKAEQRDGSRRRARFNSAGCEDGGGAHEPADVAASRSWKGKKPWSLGEGGSSADTLMLAQDYGLNSHGELFNTPCSGIRGWGL